MNLQDFSLLKEDHENYHIGHPKGKSMVVPKKGLSSKAQELVSKLKKNQNFAEGTPEGTDDEEAPSQGETLAINTQNPQIPDSMLNSNINAQDEIGAASPSSDAQTVPVPQAQTPTEAESAPSSPAAVGDSSALPDTSQGLQEAKETLGKSTAAEAQAGRKEAQAESGLAQNLGDLKQSADQQFQAHQAKDQALQQAYANMPPIDQDRYWNNKSTGSKIASTLGVIIGGLGGGTNLALQNLNQHVQNDIESQKNDQSKSMNLWKMNQQATGSDMQANLATENQLLGITKAKVAAAQAGAYGPEAAQRAVQLGMGIDQKMAMNNWMRSRLGNSTPGTEQAHIADLQVMQQVRPDLYKDMEAKYIPGVGTARIPVSSPDRETLKAYDDIQKAVTDAKAFQNTDAGVMSALPYTSQNAVAQSKKNSIALGLNKLNGLNRLNEIEYDQFMKSVDGIGSVRNERSNAQLDELSNQIQRKKQAMVQGLGIQPFKQAASNQQAMAWAKANPTDPRAAKIIQLASQ